MRIIAAWGPSLDGRSTSVSKEQQIKDFPKLQELNKKAQTEHPWWCSFGGVLRVEDRNYQVG